MKVGVGRDEDILVILDVVRHCGWSNVGQLRSGDWQGGRRVAIHGHRGVVILDLSGDVVEVVDTIVGVLHHLPASRKT